MPWARIPPDKLINLPLFGIDVVVADDGDFFWVRGPKGRMRVSKNLPRVWFETVEDALQCGALGIRITGEADQAAYDESMARLKAEEEAAEAEVAKDAEGDA
ncbi:MAG: hypothetical protein QOH47_168 [Sphingomonadales bacterium]|jgi:hypothetical protein|nr:hypothetical protein [Sphingomonadales bacterium]